MKQDNGIKSSQVKSLFKLSRQAFHQAKVSHPTWFIQVGKAGSEILYEPAGIEKFSRYMRLIAEVKAAGKVK
jgi:hypothetical protein